LKVAIPASRRGRGAAEARRGTARLVAGAWMSSAVLAARARASHAADETIPSAWVCRCYRPGRKGAWARSQNAWC